jgi:hypothetical protein
MSIQAEILARVAEGRLVALRSTMPSFPDKRRIFVVPSVIEMLDGPWSTAHISRRAGAARALLESFLQGDQMVGRMPPSKKVNTVIALLEPPAENVWEFRIGTPRPGMRILGRFAEQDAFVATNWLNREDFRDPVSGDDDTRKWRNELVRCKTVWGHLFPSYNPFKGSNLHDFISNARLPV